MRGSREISLVPSLHRASTDALILTFKDLGSLNPPTFKDIGSLNLPTFRILGP